MGSSCGFHYWSYDSEGPGRCLIWLKTKHQAKIRNKFPLVTKTMNQTDYFGMTNFGVLAPSQYRHLAPGWWVKQDMGGPWWRSSKGESESLLPSWQWRREPGDTHTMPKTRKFLPGPTDSEPRLVCPCAHGMEALGDGTPPQPACLQGNLISLAESYPESPCFSPTASRCYTADLHRTERIMLSDAMGLGAQKDNT